jgi:hypothetical protein
MAKTLFILKRREDYSTDIPGFNNYTVATGMYNSAKFVSDMLQDNSVESKIVIVVDNNDIDREVTAFKPTHVFIEGFWVVPEKFDVLKPLHPEVTWIVRCHSEAPFLAQEGIATEWIYGYFQRGVLVAGNSPRINSELALMADLSQAENSRDLTPLLPNYYPIVDNPFTIKKIVNNTVDIGCFGAMRPLKNHLIQAYAAIMFAEDKGYKLRFHINSNRIEMNGSNALKNLRGLFSNITPHELVEHPWDNHENFLNLISSMHICMQVSFTETFNIVTADAISRGVPVLVSEEVSWAMSPKADPVSSSDIAAKLNYILRNAATCVARDRAGLSKYSNDSKRKWLNYLDVDTKENKHCFIKFW